MSVVIEIVNSVVTVTSGVAAGVLFTHAVGVWPAMRAMAPEQYVAAHKLLGRAYDPMMPIMVITSTALDVVLAVADAERRALCVLAAVALVGVSLVSQTRNVPINRRVKSLDAGPVPVDWQDPRRAWGNWNLVRTTLALIAFVANTAAMAVS
jgi:uncharacterized membrane protein